MASTYTVNLGIEKIGTGEQSGTWGDTTNTNFDLIDQAVNGAVAVTLASAGTSGSPNTLAITDGATSDGRNKFIDFDDGGDLGATAYVQLTPNDAEKIVHMRNSLSGGRSLIVFQGTYNASNDFEIPNGKDVVLKFDGAGASATVTQVFEDLLVTAVAATTVDTTNIEVTNLKAKDGTSAGSIADSTGVVTIASSVLTTTDINGGSVDGVTLGTNSAVTEAQIDNININGNTISSTDTNGNVTITPDGTGSVAITKIDVAGGEIDGTAIGANSASTGSFTTLNATGGGALTGTWTDLGSVTTVDINGGTIDGVTIGGSSAGAGSFTTLTASGDVNFDSGTLFVDASADAVGIGTTSPSAALHVAGGVGFSEIKLERTSGVTANFGANAVQGYVFVEGANLFSVFTNSSERMTIDGSGNVGIGMTSPSNKLVVSDAGGAGLEFIPQTANDRTTLLSYDRNTSTYQSVDFDGSDIQFNVSGSEKARIDSSGNLLVNTSTTTSNLVSDDKVAVVVEGNATSGGIAITNYAGTSSTLGSGARLRLQRSNGTTDGSFTALTASAWSLGRIDFNGSDGTGFGTGATIGAQAAGAWGANDYPTSLTFGTAADGSGTVTERMRITSAGNVGIQTTAPKGALDVSNGSLTGTLILGADLDASTRTDNTRKNGRIAVPHYDTAEQDIMFGYIDADSSTSSLLFGGGSSSLNAVTRISFYTASNTTTTTGSEAMRIDDSGNLQFNSGYGSVATVYGCRAWVNFDGVGTVAIRESGNVSSITDRGTGQYTVNFTTAMPDANYCVTTASYVDNDPDNIGVINGGYSTTSVDINCSSSRVVSYRDRRHINVAIFR